MEHVQPSTPNQRLLQQQVVLVAIYAAMALAAMLLPLQNVQLPPAFYLPLHTLVEFVSITAAFLVFATVWHTPSKEASASLLLVAISLFAAGWLDFMHTLSYQGMPELLTPASVEKAIAFWLAARLMVAITLFGISFCPRLAPPSSWMRYGLLAAYTAVNMLVIWVVLFHEAALPDTYIQGSGLTPFKRVFEWLITSLLILAAWRYYRLARRSDDELLPLIFGAASIAALSELLLAQYEVASDTMNLLGHLYKFVCYSLIYRAMFVVGVRRPYLKLAAQTSTLQQANDTLRTQSLALESIASLVLVTDTEGRIRWRNHASQAVSGPLSAEAKRQLSLFAAPVTPDPIQATQVRTTLEAGKVWRGLVHSKDSLGHDIILDRTITPLRNDAGVIEGYVAVGEDVTNSAKAELRHKRVLDTAIDGFWISDLQGRLLEVNDAYARMSGYTTDELIGMHISLLDSVESKEDVQAHMEKIVQLGHDQFETRHRHKLGHEFAVEVSATYDPESQHFFVFTRDRSESEQSAAVKQDLERQLQQSQKVQALGQLTGGIAHDFNNILAAILGYSTLALDRFVADKQSKLANYLREVISASERARDLIAKMLSFTRTQPSASVGVISPAEVIREVVAMMRPSIPSSIQLRSRIDDDLSIRMDPGELNQVLVNLIINARDAIDGHGVIDIHLHQVAVEGQICAASHQRLSGSYLALDVSDTGSGIAPEYRSRLFDPFFTTKDVGKGTGLGLSVVHGILRRSGAHVVVDSEPGRGSRFQLLFPVVRSPSGAPGVLQNGPLIPAGTGQHIWVVDDEPAVARYLGELLGDWGYHARLFNDPAAVLTAMEATPDEIDLLITDQTMPGLNGIQLAQQLRRAKPDLPVILCSGFSETVDRAEAQRQGIRHFFGKPLAVKELLKVLAEELLTKPIKISY